MPHKAEFFPPSSRFALGVVFLVVAPALAIGQWYRVKGPIEELERIEQHRSPNDSAAYASAVYHASHARATRAARWHPTGYATTGVTGALVGAALILSARRRRPPVEP